MCTPRNLQFLIPTLDSLLNQPASPVGSFSAEEFHRDLALVMLGGRWGYLWWLMFGDEFNVKKGTLSTFPGDAGHWGCVITDPLSGRHSPTHTRVVGKLLNLSRELQGEIA